MNSRISYSIISAVILVVTAFAAFGQRARPDFNRPQTYDVQHYVIRVSFDRAAKTVNGDTTVVLKPLKTLRSVELDAVGIRFRSVRLDPSEAPLQYRTLGGKVIVALDKEYGPMRLFRFASATRRNPRKAFTLSVLPICTRPRYGPRASRMRRDIGSRPLTSLPTKRPLSRS